MLVMVGGTLGLLSVILGSIGAHALKASLSASGLASWETAVGYQMYHALALLFIGLWLLNNGPSALRYAGVLLCVGIILFSGSIYALVLGAGPWLGPITPIGGLILVAAWATLIYAASTITR
jgi:uncharacterized membrane protein YgdD (TMEM256/DUF423 family)